MSKAFTCSLLALALITTASSVAALSVSDVQQAFAQRADQSLTLVQYVEQFALKELANQPAEEAEAVLAYALQNATNDDEALSLVNSAIAAGLSADSILTAVVISGRDPALFASALETATAAGAFAPATAGLAPTAVGFGGGAGGGSGTASTN